ncbi:proteolipid protein 2 isoform X2 [Carassius carassius]|uniref:proteolipid protein 2 isoform X2 n=1 Tax=Carassius carassius TaxID=217509 RepID=UPI002868D8EF|nr:proteolipid protein 2 isoform X2 [Carassius carassius]
MMIMWNLASFIVTLMGGSCIMLCNRCMWFISSLQTHCESIPSERFIQQLLFRIKMVDTKEDNQPRSATEQNTKFIWSPKGMILALEIALCTIMTICKAVSFECYLWGCITELVWAILIFIIYAMDLLTHLYLSLMYFQWLDLFRAITGSVLLFVTSLVCLRWGWEISGEVAGSIFGLLAAAALGYDAFGIIKRIKNLKQQEATVTANVMVENVVH